MTPTQIVHELCGSPMVEDCAEASGICYVCGGQATRGRTVSDWMSGSYTDQNRVAAPTATHTCEACCFIMSRTSPVPGRPAKDGKQFGGNFRNYCHLWELDWEAPVFGDDGTKLPCYANASKGQKPLIRAFIERRHIGPWFAAIADSGQKHVLPYVPMNAPGTGGVVLFDEVQVRVPSDVSLIGELCRMLTDGATKEELARGDYRPQTWQRLGRERLRAFEATSGRLRGSWFTLALWIAQRDEDAVAVRLAAEKEAQDAKKQEEKRARATTSKSAKPKPAARRKSAAVHDGPVGDGTGGDDRGVPGCVSASVQRAPADVVLGPDPEPPPERVADKRHGCRVGHERPKGPSTRGAVQLGLFGGD